MLPLGPNTCSRVTPLQESLLGSILSNSLLVLGSAFLLGGLRYHQQTFNKHMTVTSSGLLMLAGGMGRLDTAHVKRD